MVNDDARSSFQPSETLLIRDPMPDRSCGGKLIITSGVDSHLFLTLLTLLTSPHRVDAQSFPVCCLPQPPVTINSVCINTVPSETNQHLTLTRHFTGLLHFFRALRCADIEAASYPNNLILTKLHWSSSVRY